MTLSEILRQAVATFRAHKMRTFLTMFGLVWGIASVIILVGLGRGFVVDQKKHMESLGKDLVIVWGGRTSAQVGGRAAGREIHLNVDDAELIRDECYLIKNVSPELRRTIPEVSHYNLANRGVVGMWPSYQDFRSLKVSEGRLITEDDEREGRRVLVLGSKAYRQLFPGQPAVGATVLVKSMPYTVVGVLAEKKQNSNYSGPDNDYLFAPYSAVSRDFPPPEKPGAGITRGYLDDIVFEVVDPENHEEAVLQVRRAHRKSTALRSAGQGCALHMGHDGWRQATGQDFRGCDVVFRMRGDRDAVPGWDRSHEYHAGFGHRAHARDRHAQSYGSNQAGHPAAVFCRVGHADYREWAAGIQHRNRIVRRHAGAAVARFRSASDCFADFDCGFDFDPFVDYRDGRHVSSPARRGDDTCGVTTL